MVFNNYINRFIDHFLRMLNITIIFENRYGFKSFNQRFNGNVYNTISNEIMILNPRELYLGFDALKDKYSLCGLSIMESPHYAFIKVISDGSDIKKTEYFKRYTNGYLDGRKAISVGKNEINRFNTMYALRKKELEDGQYLPVKIYKHQGRYVIFDGKHRAAFCALLGIKVKCIEIDPSNYLQCEFIQKIGKKMERRIKQYSINLSFLHDN